MSNRRSFTVLAIAVFFIGTPAFSQTPARIRGIVTAIDGSSLTIRERNGHSLAVKTDSATTYADVVSSSLNAIKVNDYVGTAVKGPLNHWIAVEIVLVPESMRPGRIGFYPWDPLPDTSGVPSPGTAEPHVASGVVSSASSIEPGMTDTSMTNGTVAAAADSSIGRTLTVTLAGGITAQIAVSQAAPVVRFVPSNRLTISKGSAVVLWTRPDGGARLVAVGKGITPPM